MTKLRRAVERREAGAVTRRSGSLQRMVRRCGYFGEDSESRVSRAACDGAHPY